MRRRSQSNASTLQLSATIPNRSPSIISNAPVIPEVCPAFSSTQRIKPNNRLPKPKRMEPENPEIAKMNEIKSQVSELFFKLKKISALSEATPEIIDALKSPIITLDKNFPAFYHQAIGFYKQYQKMQNTATQTMIVSSATIRPPLEKFSKEWESFSTKIDNLYFIHPSPHAAHIRESFLSIRHSLEIISQANEKKHHPTPSLRKSIWSIQSLCDSLAQSIVDLFSVPSFPNFQSDLYTTYRNDIKSLLRIIDDAFHNQFPSSHMLGSDLLRIKSDIYIHSNEIIQSLQGAFHFPSQMHDARELKIKIEEELKVVFERLAIPFNVITPKPENEKIPTPIRTPEQLEEEEYVDYDYESIIQRFFQKIDKTLKIDDNIVETFNIIADNYKNLTKENKLRQKEIERQHALLIEHKSCINELEKEKEQETHKHFNSIAMKNKRIDELVNSISELSHQNATKDAHIYSLEDEIDSLKTRGDPITLKNSIFEIRDMLSSALSNPLQMPSISPIDDIKLMISHINKPEVIIELQNQNRGLTQENEDIKTKIIELEDNYDQKCKELEDLHKEKENLIFENTLQMQAKENEINQLNEQIQQNLQSMEDQKKNHESILQDLAKRQAEHLKGEISSDPATYFKLSFVLMEQKFDDYESRLKDKDNRINQLKQRIIRIKDKINESCRLQGNTSVKFALQVLDEREKKVVGQLKEYEDVFRSIYLRILGVSQLDLVKQGVEETPDKILEDMFKILDEFQDEKDTLSFKLNEARTNAARLRNCLCSLDELLRKRANGTEIDVARITDEFLIQRVQSFIDIICSKDTEIQHFNDLLLTISDSYKFSANFFDPHGDEFESFADRVRLISRAADSLSKTSIESSIYSLLTKFSILLDSLTSYVASNC